MKTKAQRKRLDVLLVARGLAESTQKALAMILAGEVQVDGQRASAAGAVVASDAHNLKARPLQLRPAFDFVAERRGEEVAEALFHGNPLAAFEGRNLPYEPEPANPDTKAPQYRKRKRFIFF